MTPAIIKENEEARKLAKYLKNISNVLFSFPSNLIKLPILVVLPVTV